MRVNQCGVVQRLELLLQLRWEHVLPHLRVESAGSGRTLLEFGLVLSEVLLEVDKDQRNVVLAEVVRVALVCYFLRNLLQSKLALGPQLCNHLADLVFRVNHKEAIGRKDEDVIGRLQLRSHDLWLGYQKLLVLCISDRS